MYLIEYLSKFLIPVDLVEKIPFEAFSFQYFHP